MKNYEALVIPNPDQATKSCLDPQLRSAPQRKASDAFWGFGVLNATKVIIMLRWAFLKNLSVCFKSLSVLQDEADRKFSATLLEKDKTQFCVPCVVLNTTEKF